MINTLNIYQNNSFCNTTLPPVIEAIAQKVSQIFQHVKTWALNYPLYPFYNLYHYYHYEQIEAEKTNTLFKNVYTKELQEKENLSPNVIGENILDCDVQPLGRKALEDLRKQLPTLTKRAGLEKRSVEVYAINHHFLFYAGAGFYQTVILSPFYLVTKQMLPDELQPERVERGELLESEWCNKWMAWYTENIYKCHIYEKLLNQQHLFSSAASSSAKTTPTQKENTSTNDTSWDTTFFPNEKTYRVILKDVEKQAKFARIFLQKESFQEENLLGTLGHELGHLAHNDAKNKLLYYFPLDLLNVLSLGLLSPITYLFKQTIQRRMEFNADAFSYKLFGSKAEKFFLTTMKTWTAPEKEKEVSLTRDALADFFDGQSHPSIDRRVAALEELETKSAALS